jgi:hypothetical protein
LTLPVRQIGDNMNADYKNFYVCRKCGGSMKRVSPANTSPLIMECKRCGHREWAEIQVPPPWGIDKKELEYKRVVVYRTEGPKKVKEIRALRKLNEELGRLPADEAAKRIGSSQSIDLGVFPLKDAQSLLKRAEAWGLKARLELPEENPLSLKEKVQQFFEPSGSPVTVGVPGEDTRVIPFGWIVIGGALILGIVVWILAC